MSTRRHGWGLDVQVRGAGRVLHLAIRHNAPGLTKACGRTGWSHVPSLQEIRLIFLTANIGRFTYLIAVATAIACSSQTRDLRTPQGAVLQAGVDSAANRLLTALRADAPDSLMALMAEDVVIMPPNEAVLRGKAAVRAWYEQFLTQMRTSSLTITNREVLIGGDWATEVAAFECALVPAAGGAPVIDRGSYVQVWHREPDGRWLFSREVWNSTSPLPAPASGP